MKPISENHPDEIRLLAYMESPRSKEVKDVRRHLITCASCRQSVAKAQSVVRTIKLTSLPEKQVLRADHPDDQSIADYIEGQINPAQKEQIKSHIDSCDYCTKAALHYAIHSAEMRREIVKAPPPLNPLPQGEGKQSTSIWQRIFSWRMPAWVWFPATAFAAALVVFIILNQGQKETGTQPQIAQQEKAKVILAYQENPNIIFSPMKGKTPGIGFFSQSRGETKPFGGLTVQRISSSQYRLSWDPIDGVKLYDIRIYTSGKRGERSLVIALKGLQETNVSVDFSSLEPGQRYSWELDGQLTDGRQFVTSGVLVVAFYP